MRQIIKKDANGNTVAKITVKADGLATVEIPSLGMVMSGRDINRLAAWAEAELAEIA